MNYLKKEEVECLWHDFNKDNIPEDLLKSYRLVFKMAACYATVINSLDKIIEGLRFN